MRGVRGSYALDRLERGGSGIIGEKVNLLVVRGLITVHNGHILLVEVVFPHKHALFHLGQRQFDVVIPLMQLLLLLLLLMTTLLLRHLIYLVIALLSSFLLHIVPALEFQLHLWHCLHTGWGTALLLDVFVALVDVVVVDVFASFHFQLWLLLRPQRLLQRLVAQRRRRVPAVVASRPVPFTQCRLQFLFLISKNVMPRKWDKLHVFVSGCGGCHSRRRRAHTCHICRVSRRCDAAYGSSKCSIS